MDHSTSLPPEIWVTIVQCAIRQSTRPFSTVLNLACTSRRFHHLVFCAEHDGTIWRSMAVKHGIHPQLALDNVLYAANASLQKRSWVKLCGLLSAWVKPFPETFESLPKPTRAPRQLPSIGQSGEWFGKRTIEICAGGEGARRGPLFSTKQANRNDEGCVVVQVANLNESKTGIVAAVIDPSLGKVRQVPGKAVPAVLHFPMLYPNSAGYTVTETNGNYKIWLVNAARASLNQSWDLGKRKPDRFIAKGNKLVAVTFDDPETQPPSSHSHIATNLICLNDVDGVTSTLWEVNTSSDWSEEDDYTAFAHIKSFHLTSNYVVAIVTRHPSWRLQKLTGTYFYVLDILGGAIIRTIKFKTKSFISSFTAALDHGFGFSILQRPTPAYTTAFDHDFILTDIIAISGGIRGEILVWSLVGDLREPIYTIPDPSPSKGQFARPYTSLSMSICGQYVAAANSDRLYIFDLVRKNVKAIYENGRKVRQQDLFVKNPVDDFPAGVWVIYYDWHSNGPNSHRLSVSNDTQNFWEKTSEGVAYLTNVADNLHLPDKDLVMRDADIVQKLQRILGLDTVSPQWFILFGVGLLFSAIWMLLGAGKDFLAPHLGRVLKHVVGQSRV